MAKTLEELLQIFKSTSSETIMFGQGEQAKDRAIEFAAYANTRGRMAEHIVDERKRHFVIGEEAINYRRSKDLEQ